MQLSRKTIRARRNLFIRLGVLAAGAAALLYALYWLFTGRYWVVTDNAFVTGNLVPVYADAAGVVVEVLKEETQDVRQGELLLRLDEQRALTVLGHAEGELGKAVRAVGALFALRQQACQKIAARTALLNKTRHDLMRYRQALPSGSVSKQGMQNTEDQAASLEAELQEAKAGYKAAESRVGGATRTKHPDIEAAKNKFLEAYIEFARQRIKAPVSGYVAKRKAQVGDRVKPGDQLLTIIPLDHLWVEANLWENNMQRVRPGQPALVNVDLYGKSYTYHGTVEGLVPGSGSVFALLPPDNATGNFIHIVQRVPVRIGLRPDEIAKQPLRPGLSTVTEIDVHNAENSPNATLTEASSSEYKTVIFDNDLAKAKERAEQIINDNLTLKEETMEQACPSGG